MELKPIVKGLATYIPGLLSFARRRGGNTYSAKYCYGVWLKHLTMLWANGIQSIPETVAELGPGDSLGTGFAALLSGARTYYALDMVKYADIEQNLRIFDEMVELFNNRTTRPTKGWPDYDQYLNSNLFPSHILTEHLLESTLNKKRIESIRWSIQNMEANDGITIKYIVPWNDIHVINKNSIDLIISHSVLEHIVDLDESYNACYLWLKPMGWMSHQIDFRSHNVTTKWNGHLAYPDWVWKVIVGKRSYLINRVLCSNHINLLQKNGFRLCCHLRYHRPDGIRRSGLASDWHDIAEDDLTCASAFIQAQKI